jgi:hypothetical protein
MTLNTLQLNELESVYDTLAEALDQAGKDDEVIFLTKLALLLANDVADESRINDAIREALKNL